MIKDKMLSNKKVKSHKNSQSSKILQKYIINNGSQSNTNISQSSSNQLYCPNSKSYGFSNKSYGFSSKSYAQNIQSLLQKKMLQKYSTCQNYQSVHQINSLFQNNEKQKVFQKSHLKIFLSDQQHNKCEQKLQKYHPYCNYPQQISELLQYYKYYTQKSFIFIYQYFNMIYQYQQRKKIVQYKRLKNLLHLDQSQQNTSSNIDHTDNRHGGVTRNQEHNINKGFRGINVLDDLDNTTHSQRNQSQESLLINSLRNNMSKHFGQSKKPMTLEQLDRKFDFIKKSDAFKKVKQDNFFIHEVTKPKKPVRNSTNISRQHTRTNTLQCFGSSKQKFQRRSSKRNNSCQNISLLNQHSNVYSSINSMGNSSGLKKFKRKKNMSMDNLESYTSTPFPPFEEIKNKIRLDIVKLRQSKPKFIQKKQKQNINTQGFIECVNDLKMKIKYEKMKLQKSNNISNNLSNNISNNLSNNLSNVALTNKQKNTSKVNLLSMKTNPDKKRDKKLKH